MVPSMMAPTFTARNMVKVVSLGPMEAHITETSRITIYKVTVLTTGPTVECLSARGSTTKWKDKAHSRGPMAGNTKDSIWTIRRKVTACSSGPTAESTRADGKMESSTARARTHPPMERLSSVSGKRARESNG